MSDKPPPYESVMGSAHATTIGKPAAPEWKQQSSAPVNWGGFWFSVYCGTAIAGSVFGAAITAAVAVVTQAEPGMLIAVAFAGVFGLLYAGAVGAFVIPTTAAVSWATFITPRSPRWAAALAGGCTGAICAVWASWWLGLATGVAGAVGAVWFGNAALRGAKPEATMPRTFSLRDLFLRITVVCALLSFWMGMIRLFSSH